MYIILIILLFLLYIYKKVNIKELFKNNYLKIDAVITWVDGKDEKWLEKKNNYLYNNGINRRYLKNGKKNIRFEENNELYYCIKSINKYLPWINKIYIVTMYPQKPSFKIDSDKIKIVYHHEIFQKTNYLPTFNSQAIETQLHNIPNLSEYFIYFNDDFYIGRNLKKTFFFTKYGNPIYYKRYKINKYSQNHIELLKKNYIKTQHFSCLHQAIPLRKSYFKFAWKLFYTQLDNTSKNRFRNKEDIWIIGLIQQICSQRFVNKCIYKDINKKDNYYKLFKKKDNYDNKKSINDLNKFINKYKNLKTKPALICINNVNINNKLHTDTYKKFLKYFNKNLEL